MREDLEFVRRGYGRGLVVLAVAGTIIPCALAGGSSVIRVGVGSQTIGPWRTGTTPTLAAAVGALGRETTCTRLETLPAFARAEWRQLGLRMVFGSYGPGGARPCRARRAVYSTMRAPTGSSGRQAAG